MVVSNRTLLFQGSIFRFHVNFCGVYPPRKREKTHPHHGSFPPTFLSIFKVACLFLGDIFRPSRDRLMFFFVCRKFPFRWVEPTPIICFFQKLVVEFQPLLEKYAQVKMGSPSPIFGVKIPKNMCVATTQFWNPGLTKKRTAPPGFPSQNSELPHSASNFTSFTSSNSIFSALKKRTKGGDGGWENTLYPWTPKPWKMKVLNPQYMVYNP